MTTIDLSQLSAKELEAALIAKKNAEREQQNKKRDEYENLKNETVKNLIDTAAILSADLKRFKDRAFNDLNTLYELLKDYSKRHDEGKGNFQILSKDNQFKVELKKQEQGFFDERSKEAEKHIIEFISKRFSGDSPTKELIMSILERRKDQLDIKLVQKLYSMEDRFDDPSWKEGIKLLKESWQSSGTKTYINLYTKDEHDKWQHINLSFSSV